MSVAVLQPVKVERLQARRTLRQGVANSFQILVFHERVYFEDLKILKCSYLATIKVLSLRSAVEEIVRKNDYFLAIVTAVN